jgi:hypothetical protein
MYLILKGKNQEKKVIVTNDLRPNVRRQLYKKRLNTNTKTKITKRKIQCCTKAAYATLPLLLKQPKPKFKHCHRQAATVCCCCHCRPPGYSLAGTLPL